MKLSNGTIAAITIASAVFIGATGAVIFGATRNSDELAISSQFEEFKTGNDANIQEGSNAYKVYNIVKKFADNPKAEKLIAVEWQNWKQEKHDLKDPYFGYINHPKPYKNWLFAYCTNDDDINSYECVPNYCPSFKFEERLSGWAAVAKFMELYNDIFIPEDSATPTPAPNYLAHSTGLTDNFSSWYDPGSICNTLRNVLHETWSTATLEGLINIYIHLETILTVQNEEFSKQFFGSEKKALLITQKPSTISDISASAIMAGTTPPAYITTKEESTLDFVASTFANNYNDCRRKFDAAHNGAHFLSYESENTSTTAYTYAYVEGDEKAEKIRNTPTAPKKIGDVTYRSNDESDREAFRRYLTERIEWGINYLKEHPDTARAFDAAIKSEDEANPTAEASTPGTATKEGAKETSTNTPIAPTEPNEEEEEEEYASLSDCLKVEPGEGLKEKDDDATISDSDTEGSEGVY